MSVAEMKKQLIEKIEKIDDEILIRKISVIVNNPKPRPDIHQIYAEIKAQFGDTLKRLAE